MILFDKKKENIDLHFDMHHGYGNLDKAIEECKYKIEMILKNLFMRRTHLIPILCLFLKSIF